MTSYTLSPVWGAGAQLFDNSGNVLTGGKIYTYAAGTTTNAATYTNPTGSTFNSNPIIADASGRLSNEIWLPVSTAYKFVLKDTNDVLIATYDNIPTIPQPPVTNDASSISYEQGYTVTAGAFTVGATYRITSVGTTNFVAIGAAANITGILFTATGVGSGTGTAEYSRTVQTKLRETVSVKDFGAVGDGVTPNDTAFANAIAYLKSVNGGVINVPPGVFLFNDTITIDSSDIVIQGSGSGWFMVTQIANKAVPTTRFVFTNSSEAIHFTSVAGQVPIVRGGISDVAIDSNNVATVGLRITSLRGGLFQNLFIFDSVNDQILTDCFSGALASGYGYDTQHNFFQNISTTFSDLTTSNAYSLRLTGGQGNGGTGQGNSSCNYFMNLHLRGSATHDCVLLENTDNNQFHWIRANGGGTEVPITTGAFVFGSSDQDSGPLHSYSRFNQVHGLIAVGGLWARSGQTGLASSQNNVVFGYSRSDGADAPYYELAAGGSVDATLTVYDTNGVAWRPDDFRLRKNARLDFSLTSDVIPDSRTVLWSQLSIYEYGTLTANTVRVYGTTTAGTATYTQANGDYLIIGKLCYFTMRAVWTGHTGTGSMYVEGLPFTALNTGRRQIVNVMPSAITYTGQIMGRTEENTKNVLILQTSSGGAITGVPIAAAGTLYISGTYQLD